MHGDADDKLLDGFGLSKELLLRYMRICVGPVESAFQLKLDQQICKVFKTRCYEGRADVEGLAADIQARFNGFRLFEPATTRDAVNYVRVSTPHPPVNYHGVSFLYNPEKKEVVAIINRSWRQENGKNARAFNTLTSIKTVATDARKRNIFSHCSPPLKDLIQDHTEVVNVIFGRCNKMLSTYCTKGDAWCVGHLFDQLVLFGYTL